MYCSCRGSRSTGRLSGAPASSRWSSTAASRYAYFRLTPTCAIAIGLGGAPVLTRRKSPGADPWVPRLDATVERIFPGNREYIVRFDDQYEVVEYEGSPPNPGTQVQLTVERQSEWTRSLILRPDDTLAQFR